MSVYSDLDLNSMRTILEVTGGYWRLLEITGDYWRLLEITRYYWRLLEITGGYCRLLTMTEKLSHCYLEAILTITTL